MNLNSFTPFDADVWGTFADYCMVVVTGYTLYYLRKNLGSQLKVEEMQQTMADVAKAQYLKSIMPYFIMDSTSAQDDSLDNTRFTLYQNQAIYTSVYVNGTRSESGIEPAPQIMEVGSIYTIFLGSAHYDEIRYQDDRVFSLRYDDVYGNTWEQTIVIDDGYRKSLSYPKQIKTAPILTIIS